MAAFTALRIANLLIVTVAVLVARVPREGRPVADIERYRPQDLPARDPSNAGVIQLVDVTGLSELRSEEHTSELQSQSNLVCRLLLEKKKKKNTLVSNDSNTTAQGSHASSAFEL